MVVIHVCWAGHQSHLGYIDETETSIKEVAFLIYNNNIIVTPYMYMYNGWSLVK